jgi:dTDP-L-rhamnose 4-epimerase
VHVRDVARACRLALETPGAGGEVFNIGSGQPATIREIACRLAGVLGRDDLPAEITGQYRVGDIRHCYADISKARAILGYEPRVELEDGLRELAAWLQDQIAVDRVDDARDELAARGLAV